MSTGFDTIYEDLKSGLMLASNNVLTFFAANICILLVGVILFLIVIAPVIVTVVLRHGLNIHAFLHTIALWGQEIPWLVGGVATILVIPLITALLVVLGAIFGISKNLLEDNKTKIQLVFCWFRLEFQAFIMIALLLTTIIIFPPYILWSVTLFIMNSILEIWMSQILSIFTFIWIFISMGACLMVFPAIITGKKVKQAFLESIHLSIKYFDRVFGLWSAIVVLFSITFAPIFAWAFKSRFALTQFLPPLDFLEVVILGWIGLALILWLEFFLPMTTIAITKVYEELNNRENAIGPDCK